MNEYQIKELTNEELSSFNQEAHKTIFFDDGQIFRFVKSLNEEETKKWKELSSYLGNPLRINLGMFKGEEFVGWSWGYQESALTFYMCNSAILPEHRKKGLYTRLMNEMIKRATALGFQEIYSRHTSTNNAVIIPKLKAGFVITTMEVTDVFGVLIHLNYFPNKLRQKMMDYRVGEIKPDSEIKELLGI
jgi:ribosomal protein S18 acetylase RimI-like enzyme